MRKETEDRKHAEPTITLAFVEMRLLFEGRTSIRYLLKADRTGNKQQSGRQAAPGVRDHGVSNCTIKDLVIVSGSEY